MKQNKNVDFHCKLFYVTFAFVISATFSTWQTICLFSEEISSLLRFISLVLAALLFVESIIRYASKQQLLIILIGLLVFIISRNSGPSHSFLLRTSFVLIVGAEGICFRTIVKLHLYIVLSLFVFNLFVYSMDWIDKSLIYLADEREDMMGENIIQRFTGGYPAATDFATHILYMLLDIWLLRQSRWGKFEYMLCIVAFIFVIMKCDARQSSLCIFFTFLCSIYSTHVLGRKRMVNKYIAFILISSIPFFFFISLFVTLSYDNTNLIWIAVDYMLSHRLRLGYDGIQEFGIPWLGQNIKLIGGGFTGAMLEYNYIDNAYVQFLLRWGIFGMVLFLIAYVKIGIDAYRRNDIVTLFVMFIAGVSSITTQFLFYMHYNILLLALFSTHKKIKLDKIAQKNE